MSSFFLPFQNAIRKAGLDAWVLYDFRGSNTLAWQILNVQPNAHCTRRWMVVIPANGAPVKVVHRMEGAPLSHLTISELTYDTHQSWVDATSKALGNMKTVAMEYSPMNVIPVASKVDAGTIEFMRSLGLEIRTSADIAQEFTAVLSDEQIAGVGITAGRLRDIIMSAFKFIREAIISGAPLNEYMVQQKILAEFRSYGLQTDGPPIVAIGPNAASPHYAPSMLASDEIGPDTVVLIDAWCKSEAPSSVYADLTWVGYTGVAVPADVASAFAIIMNGRNAAVALVNQRFGEGLPVYGFEVDDACRNIINESGMGSAFIHRTGHSITTEIHGPGANMDNYETHDTRQILAGTSFSIEPGLYIPNTLGLRTEIDVVVMRDGTVTIPSAPMQTSVMPLLADQWKQ